ncbi:MAG: ABC transporter ATP-binding protein [Desulfobacteraceae bacterium]|nr:ABC transporter ATP-binding protein [Desulfobacteraceae bacterium]
MGEVLLDIQGLKTQFPTQHGVVRAVDGVDLTVCRGETLGLVGESGCGKTVIGLSIMGLIESPGRIVQGSILLNGEDLAKKSATELRKLRGDRVSMIFQDPTVTLNPVLKIGDQVAEVFRYHRGMDRKEAKQKAEEVLFLVGIPSPRERMNRYPFEFSGGMQQRVIIAIAVALDPELIIADEPTTALDLTIQAQILDILKNLKTEKDSAIMLITHDMGVVAELCETVAVAYAGNIVEHAGIESILEHPKHPYTIGLMNSVPKLEDKSRSRLKPIPGVLADSIAPPNGCKFNSRCTYVQARCFSERPLMREIAPGHKLACHLNLQEE